MAIMSALDWLFQFLANVVSWLGSMELVTGISLLHMIVAFIVMGVVIGALVPRA